MTTRRTYARRTIAALSLATTAAGCGGSPPPSEDVGESTYAITPIPGVDYAWYRPSPSTLKADGYKFAARYLSHDTTGKTLSATEANALKAAGLDLVTMWEDSATAALSGHAQGVADAQAAKAQAAADGEPSTRPIYFCIDFDAQSTQTTAIDAYFDGVVSVLGLARTGAYGGHFIVNHLFNVGKIKWAWQTYAWSGGVWDSRAQLRQIQNGIAGGEMDLDNGVAADFGQWGPNAPVDPPRGNLDSATCTDVVGWAEEQSSPGTAIPAEIYFNGPSGGSGATGFRLTANIHRADLCTAISSCDHGFSMATPRGVMDTKAHKVYAYGINPTSGGPNTLLPASPKTITCTPPAIPTGDVKRHVTSPTILTDWRFDTFVDESPYTTAELAAVADGVDFGAAPDIVQVAGNAAIYVVDGAYRRHVVNGASFAAWRMKSTDVKPITAAALAALAAGPDWPAAPLLVKDPSNPAVYLLDVPFPAPVVPDAGTHDAATHDSGALEGGAHDASSGDGGARDAAMLDGGTAPLGDAGGIVFADGGVVIDGSVIAVPMPIPDGGALDATVEQDATATNPGSTDAGAGATTSSAGGCSVAATSTSADLGWLAAVGAVLVARRPRRRRA